MRQGAVSKSHGHHGRVAEVAVTAGEQQVLRKPESHILVTGRLLLIPITEKLEEEIYELHNDPLVVRSLFDGGPPSREDTRVRVSQYAAAWRQTGFGFFAVYLKDGNGVPREFVGRSGLRYLDGTEEIEFGHVFFGRVSGQGIAAEAGRAVLKFGFEELGVDRIVAVVRPANERGLKALARIGFRYVGDRKHYGRMMKYFSVTASEHRASGALAGSAADAHRYGQGQARELRGQDRRSQTRSACRSAIVDSPVSAPGTLRLLARA